MTEAYLSQLRRGHRNIGDKTARKIEAAMDLYRGWLDTLGHDLDEDTYILAKRLSALPDGIREEAKGYLAYLEQRARRKARKKKPKEPEDQ